MSVATGFTAAFPSSQSPPASVETVSVPVLGWLLLGPLSARRPSANPGSRAGCDGTRGGLAPGELARARGCRRGATYQGVATQLGIEVGTVQTYIRSIYRKLQVENAVRAVVLAIERGLI